MQPLSFDACPLRRHLKGDCLTVCSQWACCGPLDHLNYPLTTMLVPIGRWLALLFFSSLVRWCRRQSCASDRWEHSVIGRVGLETPKACKKVLLTYGTKTPCKKLVLLTVNNRSRDLKKNHVIFFCTFRSRRRKVRCKAMWAFQMIKSMKIHISDQNLK